MFFFFYDSQNIKIEIGLSPKDSELAIVSIDQYGNLGELNNFVLKEYGYSEQILKDLDLKKGFDLFQLNHKPILFIVTISDLLINNQNKTKQNLSSNLSKAIDTYFDLFKSKSIWIPLMGTGSGGLKLEESLNIITDVLKTKILNIEKNNCSFNISIPNSSEGQKLLKKIAENNNSNQNANISRQNAQKIINDVVGKFYLVGSNWGHAGDQSEKFYKKGVWENGYDDGTYSEIVNSVKVNDILINKSTFATKEKENFLRIKAIGIVTKNFNNGRELEVQWIYILEEFKDIKGLSFYRDTITTPNPEHLLTILSSLDSQDFEELYFNIVDNNKKLDSNITIEDNKNSKVPPINKTTTLAGLISDIETGTDYLDITKDVNAFARVMAAKSFEPPLAIALLGKWGSGKSFFMRKLKEGIQILSEKNPDEQFCEGIAHMHFNAWSYMDANLWASIVTRIFEGLNEYIKNDTKANSFKKEIEKKLTQNLNIAKEEIATLEKQSENISAQIEKLSDEKEKAEKNLKEKIELIKKSTIKAIINKVDEEFKVNEQINTALANNETFVNSTNRLKKIVPEQYWMNPSELHKQLKSKYTFIKTFFFGENWWKNCLWLAAFLIIVFYTPIFTFISALLLSWHDFTLTPKTWTLLTIVGTALVRGIDTYKKLKTLIAPFWKIKENYEAEKENALFEFHQKEKALKLEIENGKNEIIAINEQINKAIVIKASIEFKLENALSTEALYSFIERRANSEDYKKHLGIVSIIRKDFEVLSDLLVDHKHEAFKNSESQEFNAMFNKPLERIILYIDDLDRCPEERVVEVLEAVNLLMAFPLFVVVVGVDPRWVKTALQKKYKKQFSKKTVNEDVISPSNYLEKIFQVPFHLKDAEDESIKSMIKTLAQIKPNIISSQSSVGYDPNDYDASDYDTANSEEQPTHEEIEEVLNSGSTTTSLLNKETIEALNISENECDLLQNMSQIIGNNPRAIKRFVNIYRIVKTHEDFGFNNEETKDAEQGLIMLILALFMGNFKQLMQSLESFLSRSMTMNNENLRTYLKSEYLDEALKNSDGFHNKRKQIYLLIDKTNPEILDQSFSTILKHYQFIKRFTFKNI